jgi:hypothetical protein
MVVNDNYEAVTCRICGELCKRIYGKHLKFAHNNMTTEEYKRLYPGSPIAALSDKISTSKNSGQFMKQDKYRKMYSDKIKGDKNPNHKSNTTEQDRKSRSPFSKEFIKYEGVENIEEHVGNFIKIATKNRISNTNLKYYLNRGYEEEVASKMLSDRQRTFTLEKCVDKYGEEIGLQKWKDRQEKWLNSYKKINYSKISQEMFISVYKNLKELGFDQEIYFAKLDRDGNIHDTNKNYEYRLNLNKSYILPDFFIPSLSLIVEFDGTYYHRDNAENKKREEIRDRNIKDSGYSVIHIKENEYNSNKELTVFRIINHILKMKQLKNA